MKAPQLSPPPLFILLALFSIMKGKKGIAPQLTFPAVVGDWSLAGLSEPHVCSSRRSSWLALLLRSAQHLRHACILDHINPLPPSLTHTLLHTPIHLVSGAGWLDTPPPTLFNSLPWHNHTSLHTHTHAHTHTHTHRMEDLWEHLTHRGSTNKASYFPGGCLAECKQTEESLQAVGGWATHVWTWPSVDQDANLCGKVGKHDTASRVWEGQRAGWKKGREESPPLNNETLKKKRKRTGIKFLKRQESGWWQKWVSGGNYIHCYFLAPMAPARHLIYSFLLLLMEVVSLPF